MQQNTFPITFCQDAKNWITNHLPKKSAHRVLVSGGNTGIGLAMCYGLGLLHLKEVVLVSRCRKKGSMAKNYLAATFPNTQFSLCVIDLASQSSIKAHLHDLTALGPFDSIIHNAGVAHNVHTPPLNADGLSTVFFTNALAPVVLTHHLLTTWPTHPLRNITVSSLAYLLASPFSNKSIQTITNPSSAQSVGLYSDSKRCNLLWTYQLQKIAKKENRPLTALSTHPGLVFTQMNQSCLEKKILNLIRNGQWACVGMRIAHLLRLQQQDALWAALPAITATTASKPPSQHITPSGFLQIKGLPCYAKKAPHASAAEIENFWTFAQKTLGLC